MNLHKLLAIALFSCFAQPSLQAGLITFSDEEIEAKDPNSVHIDKQTGIISMKFNHDHNKRYDMLYHNIRFHDTAALISFLGLFASSVPTTAFSVELGWKFTATKTAVAITTLLTASCVYNFIKGWTAEKAKVALSKNEYAVVGKVIRA